MAIYLNPKDINDDFKNLIECRIVSINIMYTYKGAHRKILKGDNILIYQSTYS
jgi:hypothetical protein